jgi:hypothetical protein
MTRIRRYCDRCHEPIEAGRVKLVALLGVVLGWPTAISSGRHTVDLCRPCAGTLQGWLRTHKPATTSR